MKRFKNRRAKKPAFRVKTEKIKETDRERDRERQLQRERERERVRGTDIPIHCQIVTESTMNKVEKRSKGLGTRCEIVNFR